MFCNKCGSPVKPGELFCSACGAKLDAAGQGQTAQEPVMQQPAGQQPIYTQPYVQQPNGQAGGQPPYGQPPYGQPPYGQAPSAQPPKKKSKKLLWIGIAAVLVLAIAAAVVFVVLPTLGGGAGPLSGNTTQTKFVNDTVKVFSGAFSDFGSDTFSKLLKEPFDLSMNLTSDVGGEQVTGTVEAAYDKQALGFSAESNGVAGKVLLKGDTLYTDSNGIVSGLKFITDADLSKAMSLSDRLKAIFEDMSGASGKAAKLDYKRIAEMLVNSISADCFVSSGETTTLTLKPGDIVDTLKTFTDKLDKDKALKQQLEDYIKEVSGTTVNVVDALDTAVQALEAAKGSVDFEIVWEISYDDGKPVSMQLSMNMSEDSFKFDFGYEKQDGGNNVTFGFSTQDESVDVKGNISYKKTGSGIEYSGSVTAMDQTLTISGSEEWSGGKTQGEINISVPGSDEISLQYDESLKFGAAKNVVDDSRFSIDTSNAEITEMSSILDYFTIASSTISQITPQPQSEEPAVTEEPAASEQPTGAYEFGFIIPDDQNTFFQGLATAMQTELGNYGGNLTVLSSANDTSQEQAQVSTLLASGIDGIVVYPVSDSAALSSMQSQADAAGVPILFISDFTDGTVNAVACDFESMCSTLSGYCSGNVYIINSWQGVTFSDTLEQSFTSALSSNPDVTVVGSGYSNFDIETAKTLTGTALQDYSDLNTVVCLDPVSAPDVLETLNTNGFAGKLVCFTDEVTMNGMTSAAAGSTAVTYGYFPVSDTAYTAVNAMLELKAGSTAPQVYYLTPYTY